MDTEEETDDIEVPVALDAKSVYVASLRPEARSLRDGYLQGFNQHYKIGKLFSSAGGVLFEGKTATEWMETFRIIPPKTAQLDSAKVRGLFIALAQAYHTASSFHGNLNIAAQKLSDLIEEREAAFIVEEVNKYRRGGIYWDNQLNKLKEKRPAKESLERMANHHSLELRRAHKDLQMEVVFFQHILADLEAQRRCLKDYSELLSLESKSNL